VINQLTEAQVAMMPHYVDKWVSIGKDTRRMNRELAVDLVNKMYQNGGIAPPKNVLFANGPSEGFKIYMDLGGSNMSNFLNGVLYGNHDSHWLSLYDYFMTEIGVKNLEPCVPLINVANECGWIYCAKETAIVMEKPITIKMDEDNRLHCDHGPSIEYADGFTVFSWHGVRIPGEWIMDPESLTASKALAVENTEQRRAACEILGWVNILKELNSTVIDEDEDPMIGTLLEVDIPEIGREKFLKVLCGTGRTFAIPVPPEMTTALDANAWTYDIPPDFLRNVEVRT
jgi:hypothetical protein